MYETLDPTVKICYLAALKKQAETIQVFKIADISSLGDYFMICHGHSSPQVQAIADSITSTMRAEGYTLLSKSGYSQARWIVLDFGHLLVHIFLEPLREFYQLDQLWQNAPQMPLHSITQSTVHTAHS